MEHIRGWVSQDFFRTRLLPPGQDFAVFDPNDAPTLDALSWNKHAPGSNCYAYALDALGEDLMPGEVCTDHPPQIRKDFMRAMSGIQQMDFCAFADLIRKGLELDGLLPVHGFEEIYKPGFYLIALFFNLGGVRDVHFLRQDSNSAWSHKNLKDRFVSQCDLHDNKILNPARAAFGSDMRFGGFYHVPRGGYRSLTG